MEVRSTHHWLCTAAMVFARFEPYQSARLSRYNAGP
jgi:hypothetical protein